MVESKKHDKRTKHGGTRRAKNSGLIRVHTAISNLKSQILNTYKHAKDEFLQYYIDEFYCKYNRRNFYKTALQT